MSVDFSQIVPFLGPLLTGASMTLLVSFSAIALGMAGGLALCFTVVAGSPLARRLGNFYISFFRGTPLLVQLLISFYFLPPLLGLDVPPLVSAIGTLGMNTSAFQAEIYRGGLLALPRGHFEAARMLGISVGQTRRVIQIPQILRLVLAPLTNEAISIVKSSSLVSVIAVTELMRVSEQAVSITFRATEFYVAAAFVYLVLTGSLAWASGRLQRRLARWV
jgi:polar amino acid transport system permease protein